MYKILFFSICVFAGLNLRAQTWNGSISTNWNTAGNWTGGLPGAGSNVTIPGSVASNNWPVLNSNITINGMFMNSGSRIDVNGFTLTLNNGTNVNTNFTGAIFNNSNGATDIVFNINTGSGGANTQFNSNTVNDAIIFNLTGTNAFYEGNVAPANQFNGSVSVNCGSSGSVFISHVSPSFFTGNLSITRTIAGPTQAFNSGGIVTGNLSYINNTAGNAYFGNNAVQTTISGMVNMTSNLTAVNNFEIHRLINQTNGGTINIQNSRGFLIEKDTLKVVSLSVTNYTGLVNASLLNNSIEGNVSLTSDISYTPNFTDYRTYVRSNVITGDVNFTNDGGNQFLEADIAGSGNYFGGNASFTAASSGNFVVSHLDTSTFNGNIIFNRTVAGFSQLFNSGGIVNGNFSFTNNSGGDTYFGNIAQKTSIGGTVNIAANYVAPARFELYRLINQTGGGNINVQDSRGFQMQRDTLLVNSISATGYRGTQNAILSFNNITGNVTLTSDISYTPSFDNWNTFIRSNVITGDCIFTNSGGNGFHDADGVADGNKYIGNVSYTRIGGTLNVGLGDTTEISGNLTINSPSNINLGKLKFNLGTNGVIEQLSTQPVSIPLLIMEKTSGASLTLNDSLRVTTTSTFTSGNIYSSINKELIFPDNISHTGASTVSHVIGPVTKIGDDIFTFPVGGPVSYNPVTMSAPAGATSRFRAEYINQNPTIDGYNTSTKAGSFGAAQISNAGYWNVQRLLGTTNVTLTLGFNDNPYQQYPVLANLKVAHWNGSQWDDHGNGGTTGTSASGTVVNSVAITSFSPFAIAGITPTYFFSFAQPGPGPDGTPLKLKGIGGWPAHTVKELPAGVYTADSIFLVLNGSTTSFRLKDLYGVEKDTTITVAAAPSNYISANGNGSINFTGWRHFVYLGDGSGNMMGAIRDNDLTLGNINMTTYFSTPNVATAPNGNKFLKRSFKITSQLAPAGTKRVRLYISKTEYNNLVAADPASFPNGISSLTITKYTGPMEDSLFNPIPGGNAIIIPNSSITIADLGTMYSLDIDVSGFSGFYIGGNMSNLNVCSGSTVSLSSDISGASYQWQVDNGSGYVNVTNSGAYTGASTSSLTITNAPGSIYGYKYRCLVNGNTFSQVYTIKFNALWQGTVSNVWENTANWSCGILPDANTDVVLNAGKPFFPQINSNTTVRTLTANTGTTVTVKTGVTLTVLK